MSKKVIVDQKDLDSLEVSRVALFALMEELEPTYGTNYILMTKVLNITDIMYQLANKRREEYLGE